MNYTTADVFNGRVRLGILGGGQLGKMLAQAGADWHLPIHILDQAADFPAAPYATEFTQGSFAGEADVLRFGRGLDVVTIEIEHISTKALRGLRAEGVQTHPDPDVVDIIKDKGLQKQHLAQHGLPTSPFTLYIDEQDVRAAVADGRLQLPFVQKSRTGGYDGRGVAVMRTEADLESRLLPGNCLVEALVDIDKELAVIVARNADGEERAFPVVEMDFNPEANLVEFLLCPARIDEATARRATEVALATARAFGVSGLLAVELFLTRAGEILVNEVAPRPHNSGHHTIEACLTSQYEQHLRGVLNLPLGDTTLLRPAVMLNLLGEAGHSGPVYYEGMDAVLHLPGVYVHLYGKTTTKPFRKMGHVTVLGETLEEAIWVAREVRDTLRVVSRP